MSPTNETETVAPVGAEHSTLYVAIEISRKSWVVGVKSPASEKIGLHSLGPADKEGLKDLIENQRAKAERVLGRDTLCPQRTRPRPSRRSARSIARCTKGCLSHGTALAMVFKLVTTASKTWRRLMGNNQLPKLIEGVRFKDGIQADETETRAAA